MTVLMGFCLQTNKKLIWSFLEREEEKGGATTTEEVHECMAHEAWTSTWLEAPPGNIHCSNKDGANYSKRSWRVHLL